MQTKACGARLAWFAFLGLASALNVVPATAQDYVPSQVLVKFTSIASPAGRDSAVAEVGGAVTDSIKLVNGYVIQLADTAVIAAVATLENHYAVDFAAPNHVAEVVITAPNDSLFSTAWHLHNTGQSGGTSGADVDALKGWAFQNVSPDVVIAVLDTGIDYEMLDLVNNIWTNTGETPGNSIDDDGNGYVDDVHGYDFVDNDADPMDLLPPLFAHGTGVATVLGAEGNNSIGVTGVTWQSQIVPVKIIEGSLQVSDWVNGIGYALKVGAKIMSNSYRTYSQNLFAKAAVESTQAHGILFVAGSGNEGRDNDYAPTRAYPASWSFDNILSVGMTDRTDSLATWTRPCQTAPLYPKSNYGATTVDLAAPGCEYCLGWPLNSYNCGHSGTSLSTPLVAGGAALLWAQNPTWTYSQVKSRLMATVDTLASCVGRMVAPGRMNLDRALDNVRPSAVALTVESSARWSQAISWTDTGDDSTWGQSRAYVLKRSTSPITTQSQFNNAQTIVAGTPGPSGTYHCVEVDGLSSCTTYYWSMQLEDNAFNVSNLATAASATTTCSGNTYVVCDGGGLLQGGDGGGGEGGEEMSRQFPGHEYQSASARGEIGSSLLSREGRDGWIAENRLISGESETSFSDLIEMRQLQVNRSSDYLVRILQAGSGSLNVARATLGVLDRPAEASAVVTSNGVAVGQELAIVECRTASGSDVTANYTSGVGRETAAGEELLVTLPQAQGTSHLVLDVAAAPAPYGAEPGGINIQRRGEGGEWLTFASVALRRQSDRTAVDVGGAHEVRLVAVRPATIRSLSALAEVEVVQPNWVEASAAKSRGVDRLESFVTQGEPVVLEQADDLVLTFPASGQEEGTERVLFFSSETRETEGSGLEPDSREVVVEKLKLGLGLARPNPASGNVSFSYTLPNELSAQLSIYDAAGRLVRSLDQGVRPAGVHQAVWDGRAQTGRKASPGVYFYRLEAGGQRSERKLVVVTK